MLTIFAKKLHHWCLAGFKIFLHRVYWPENFENSAIFVDGRFYLLTLLVGNYEYQTELKTTYSHEIY